MFQRNTLVLELLCCPDDIRHMPAQDGVFRCRYFWNISNSKHGSSRVEYERKFVLAHQLQTKDIPIEFLGANGVTSGDECHKFLRLQHRLLSLSVSRLISSPNLATLASHAASIYPLATAPLQISSTLRRSVRCVEKLAQA